MNVFSAHLQLFSNGGTIVSNLHPHSISPRIGELGSLKQLSVGDSLGLSFSFSTFGFGFRSINNIPLTGTLVNQLGSLRLLTELQIYDCGITGTIPTVFSTLAALKELSVVV